jgi:CHAT domain-containing protein
VQVSPEISAVTDRFVGPGLHIVQGVALKADEFRDDRFTGARLIHLAIPGTIDLEHPDRSRLLMSRSGENSVVEYLSPADIRELHFNAGLAVLSLTHVAGTGSSGFSNRLGFVSDFLDQGVRHVLASLWTGEDTESTAFFAEFYDNLAAGQDIEQAFSQVRKKRLKYEDQTNFKSWAGFQLFIR